ncbi:MAG: response regulator [Pseudomonadota bacterium]
MTHTDLAALLVDDEPIAREVIAFWLEQLGFSVATTGSAAQALSLAAQQRFDVIVTDVHLESGQDGFELAAAVADRQPHIRALFVSAEAWGPSQVAEPDTTFLHKPFTLGDLDRAMRLVLSDDQRLTSRCLKA